MTIQTDTLTDMLGQVSAAELMWNTDHIARWIRLSAMPEEWAAAEYVRATLESYGVATRVHEAEILVSLPRSASVSVVGSDTATFQAYTHSFAPSTPPGGLTGEVVYVGRGTAADYQDQDVRGKIALIDGLASPPAAWAADQAGAAAQIFISGEHLHFMIVSTVWGIPTPETAGRLPKTSSASITRADGQQRQTGLDRGPVRVRVETETWTGWSTARMVEGRLDGASEPDTFVLLSGHLDSWEYGAMDNGSANATMMEVMRVLAQNQASLRRGVRALFWSGHSHGRYAGSTWYVDHYWQELYDGCVAHVNVDSTGARGATAYDEAHAMSDVGGLVAEVVQQVTGQTPKIGRMGRNSDQSFWGLGIPAMFGMVSRTPLDPTAPAEGGLAALGITGMPWWWHTVEDTIDKIDPQVLTLDTQVTLAAVQRLGSARVLPFDYTPMVDELAAIGADLQQQAGERFDLQPVAAELGRLREGVAQLNKVVERVDDDETAGRLNRTLMRLGRLMIPLNYTRSGPYDQDLALSVPPLPSLQPVAELAQLDAKSDAARFLETRLLRERNRAVHILRQANELVAGL
ncbi:MAG: M28 family peptidase [Anaerolineae bacterium]|nr:M28 family peptidase [Anaerolineae bacterium]